MEANKEFFKQIWTAIKYFLVLSVPVMAGYYVGRDVQFDEGWIKLTLILVLAAMFLSVVLIDGFDVYRIYHAAEARKRQIRMIASLMMIAVIVGAWVYVAWIYALIWLLLFLLFQRLLMD